MINNNDTNLGTSHTEALCDSEAGKLPRVGLWLDTQGLLIVLASMGSALRGGAFCLDLGLVCDVRVVEVMALEHTCDCALG